MARRGSLHQDYYQTLGLEAGASEEEIRKAYRRLAFEFHPDRNPGDKGAEERFKQISEAYACLADKANRERYDRARSGGFDPYRYQGGPFSNGQGEGFRDFFSGSQGKDIFSELREEFAAFGLRFDEEFLRRVFFQGQSSYFRRIQFGFPGGFGTYRAYYRNTSPSGRYSDLVGPRISSLLMQSVLGSLSSLGMSRLQERWMGLRDALRAFWNGLKAPSPDQAGSDLHSDLEISLQEAVTGCQRVFSFIRHGKEERILLKIPPGVKSGTRLRIVGRGLVVKDGCPGSLYIRLKILSDHNPRSSAAGSFHAR